MRVAALVSGGKDSWAAVWLAKKAGHEIKYLIAVQPAIAESYMFHYPNVQFVKMQAKTAALSLLMIRTAGQKERELLELEKLIKKIKKNIAGVVSGAIASQYQKKRIDNLCEKNNLTHITPLWQVDTEAHWQNLLKNKFEVAITAVAASGLDESWLGKVIDKVAFEQLKELSILYKFNLAGEGGEFETFVLDCPLFKKKISILEEEKIWDPVTLSGQLAIKKAEFA